jgi:hypothetical protein
MPTYSFRNKETGEVFDKILKISEREEFLASGEYEQLIGAPSLVTHTGNIVNKTSSDWKDLLKKIDKGSGKNTTIHY